MKIQGENPLSTLRVYLKGAKEVKKEKEVAYSAPPPTADRVEISGKAQEIARLSRLVSGGSDVREEKVSDAQRKKSPEARVLAESLVKSTVLDKIL